MTKYLLRVSVRVFIQAEIFFFRAFFRALREKTAVWCRSHQKCAASCFGVFGNVIPSLCRYHKLNTILDRWSICCRTSVGRVEVSIHNPCVASNSPRQKIHLGEAQTRICSCPIVWFISHLVSRPILEVVFVLWGAEKICSLVKYGGGFTVMCC